jgi:uncharacterized membrane protein YciS (DUF1049 family)
MIFAATASIIEFVTGESFASDHDVLKVLVALLVGATIALGAAVCSLFWLLHVSNKRCIRRHESTWEHLSVFRSIALTIQNCTKKGCPLADITIPDLPSTQP